MSYSATRRSDLLCRLGIFWTIALVAASAVASDLQQADDAAPPLPERSSVEVAHEGDVYRIEFVHELINDPDVSTVFNVPGHTAIGPDGRQYYVDSGDHVVHVLDDTGSHLVDIGAEGQGPGEFQSPRLVALSPEDETIYVWDRTKRSIEVFDGTSYEYVRSSGLPFSIQGTSMHVVGSDVVLLGGTTLAEPGYGLGVHMFSIGGSDAEHLRSFAEIPEVDPAFYEMFARGYANIDLDGGILFNQMAPYSVRKYSRDGSLRWRIDDPDLVPPPLASAIPDAAGRLQVGRYAVSGPVIPVDDGLYLHIIFNPPDDAPERRVLYKRVFELIEVQGDSPIRRIRFDVPDPLLYTVRDLQGRLYGLWHEWDFEVIRSTINISKGRGS